MNDQEIQKDRQSRVILAKDEITAILTKYELDLQAEDHIGEHTKISVELQFRDTKKYPEAKLAQEEAPVITPDLLTGEGDPIK